MQKLVMERHMYTSKTKDDLLTVLMEDVMNQFYDIAERSFSPQTKEEARNMIQNQVRAFLQLAEKERAILQSCRRSNRAIKRDTSKMG